MIHRPTLRETLRYGRRPLRWARPPTCGAFPTWPFTLMGGPYDYVAPGMHDSLIAYWKLGEASGTRVDSHGSNNITDNNTVTQAAGIQGNAAQFTAANSEYLSLADNAAMSTANIDWAFAGWVYFDTVVGGIAEDLVAKYNSSVAAEREYLLFLNSSSPNRLSWSVRDGAGGTETNVTASTFGTVPTAQWLFVVVDHNAATDIISIAVNNGTADTASHTVGGADTIAPFAIGVRSGGSSYMNGRIDETAFWKRILTSDERSYLWNGGLGRTYPLTTP